MAVHVYPHSLTCCDEQVLTFARALEQLAFFWTEPEAGGEFVQLPSLHLAVPLSRRGVLDRAHDPGAQPIGHALRQDVRAELFDPGSERGAPTQGTGGREP